MKNSQNERSFPPKKLNFLTHKKFAGNFLSLQRKVSNGPSTLFLGSGISKTANLPDWKSLLKTICEIFLVHWFFEKDEKTQNLFKPPHKLSIAFTDVYETLCSEKMQDIAEKFLSDDLLMLTQQIKNCIRPRDWKYLLRKSLYINGPPRYKSSLIESITALIKQLDDQLVGVINYNYDDAVELNLKEKNIRFKTVTNNFDLINDNKLNIFHPHGYIPYSGGAESDSFVLSEDTYQEQSNLSFSINNNIQLSSLYHTTCIFIGLSMRDPHLRKLLKFSCKYSKKKHFVLINENPNQDKFNKMKQALFDKDLKNIGVNVIRYPLSEGEKGKFKKLPLLINYLVEGIKDDSFIWQ